MFYLFYLLCVVAIWFFRTNPDLGNNFIDHWFAYKSQKMMIDFEGRVYERELKESAKKRKE